MLTPSMLWHKSGFVISFCGLNVVGPSFMCGDLVICMKALNSRTKGRDMIYCCTGLRSSHVSNALEITICGVFRWFVLL